MLGNESWNVSFYLVDNYSLAAQLHLLTRLHRLLSWWVGLQFWNSPPFIILISPYLSLSCPHNTHSHTLPEGFAAATRMCVCVCVYVCSCTAGSCQLQQWLKPSSVKRESRGWGEKERERQRGRKKEKEMDGQTDSQRYNTKNTNVSLQMQPFFINVMIFIMTGNGLLQFSMHRPKRIYSNIIILIGIIPDNHNQSAFS